MKWVELRYYLFPLFIQQIEKVEKQYMELIRDITVKKDKIKEMLLNDLKNDIANRIEEIDNFIEDNFEKENVLHFEKGRLKLKKLILINPHQIFYQERKSERKLLDDDIEDENEVDRVKEEECPIYNRSTIVFNKELLKKDQQMKVLMQNVHKMPMNNEEENKKGKTQNKKILTNTTIKQTQHPYVGISNSLKKDHNKVYHYNEEDNDGYHPTNNHHLNYNNRSSANILSFQYKNNEDKLGSIVYSINNNNDNKTIKTKQQATIGRVSSSITDINRHHQINSMAIDNKKSSKDNECNGKTNQNNQSKPQIKPMVNQSLMNKEHIPESKLSSSNSQANIEERDNELELKEMSLLFKLNEKEYLLLQKEKAKRVIVLSTS